jgi:PKD repeat protein
MVFPGSYIQIDPVGTRQVDQKITITATTDLPAGSQVLFEVLPTASSPNRKSQSGEYSGATGTVNVNPGQDSRHNLLGFDVDLAAFQPGDYHILASAASSDVTGTGEFTVVSASNKRTPVPLFTWSPHPAVVNEPVVFDGSGSADPDGKILTWQWDFGDGTPLTSPTGSPDDARTSHTYQSAGKYTVGLKVMDNSEQVVWAYHEVNVVVPVPPVADFSMSPSVGQAYENHPFAVSLSDNSTGSPLAWAWYVDDVLVSQMVTYSQSIFTKPGNYTIRLVVTNDFGTSAREKQVMVLPFNTSPTTPVTSMTTVQTTVQPMTTITTVLPTPLCTTCNPPCVLFTIPCLWIEIFVIIIIVISVIWYILKHWPPRPRPTPGPTKPPEPTQEPGTTEPHDPPPPEVTIEARGGISPRGLDLTNLDVHMEVEAGIKHHHKEE